MRTPHEPPLVEAGFQPAGEGGILPPGWEAGRTGSQGWLPPRFKAGEHVCEDEAAFRERSPGSALVSLALALFCELAGPAFGAAPATVAFVPWNYGGPETNSSVQLQVVRSGDTNLDFTVDYATSNGTATAAADYVAQSGTLHFLPGQTTQSITLTLLDDYRIEDSWEQFHVWLSNPTAGVAIESVNPAWILVGDDEAWSFFDGSFDVGGGPDGTVFALALQPDGKIVAAGDFIWFRYGIPWSYSTAPTNRTRVARLNPDGTLDLSFDPAAGPDAIVYALALQTNGQVLIGGSFTNVAGVMRRYLARLHADGSLDTNFVPVVNNELRGIAVQPDGRIVIVGRFTSVAGTARSRVARLNADGSLDTTFNPGSGANDHIRALALQEDGRVLIAGQFSSVNGTNRNGIARLNTNGTLDLTFAPGSGADDIVRAVAIQADGRVLIGGEFLTVNGTNRARVARLHDTGGLDLNFDPGTGPSDVVRTVALQPDNRVLIGGQFTAVNGIARSRIARLQPDGTVDTEFRAYGWPNTGLNDEVFATLVQPDGFLVLGGQFVGTNGWAPSHLTRIFGDQALPSFAWSSEFAFTGEDATEATVIVRRLGDTSGSLSVDFATSDGTAVAGSDYVSTNGTLTFAPRELTQTLILPVVNDYVVELDEFFRLRLRNPSPGAGLGQPREVAIYIHDNDAGLNFTGSGFTTNESAGTILANVTRGGDSAETVTVEYFTTNGTALAGVDYVPTNGVLTFGPGESNQTIAVTILPDSIIEGSESLGLVLTNASGIGLGRTASAQLNIVDASGSFAMARSNVVVREDVPGGLVAVEVQRLFAGWGEVSVDYATQDGTAKAGEDYVPTTGTLVFGNQEYVKTLYVPIINDGAGEPYEDFKVVLSNPSTGASISWIPFTWVTLVDEDGAIQFASTNLSVAENAGTVTATVERLGAVTNTATINFSTASRSVEGNRDYLHTTGTLTFTNGQTSKTITVPILNDGLMEGSESFIIELFNPVGATVGPARAVTVTILDNDGAIRLVPATNLFLGTNLVISESAGQAIFTVERNSDGQGPVTVDYVVVGGTASNGLDYVVSGSSAAIPAGGTNATISIAILEDTLAEPDETLFVRLTTVRGDGSLGEATNTPLVILDNDRPGTRDETFNVSLPPGFRLQLSSPPVTTVQPDGKILVGAYVFADSDPNQFSPVRRILVRLQPDGSWDPSLNVRFDVERGDWVKAMAVQPDGRIVASIIGIGTEGFYYGYLARFNTNGTLDTGFNAPHGYYVVGTDISWLVNAITLQPDGRILVMGSFPGLGAVARPGIARLLPDGSLDPSFDPGSGLLSYFAGGLAAQPDGRIIVGGAFFEVDGVSRSGIARLLANGALDARFNPGSGVSHDATQPVVEALALQPDGRVLIAGQFTAVNGTNRSDVARLNADGSLDLSFAPRLAPTDHSYVAVNALALQPDGRIVIGGNFTNVNGLSRPGIARLNVDGSLDPSFDPGFDQQFERVLSVTLQPDGQVLVAHDDFYGWGEPRLVRLNGGPSVNWEPKVELLLPWTNGQPRIGFNTLQGRRYDILASSRLTNWSVISSNWSTGSRLEFTDTNAPGLTNRFYRVRHFSP